MWSNICGFPAFPWQIKGTHTAMKSGMLAAESIFSALCPDDGQVLSLSLYPLIFPRNDVYFLDLGASLGGD